MSNALPAGLPPLLLHGDEDDAMRITITHPCARCEWLAWPLSPSLFLRVHLWDNGEASYLIGTAPEIAADFLQYHEAFDVSPPQPETLQKLRACGLAHIADFIPAKS